MVVVGRYLYCGFFGSRLYSGALMTDFDVLGGAVLGLLVLVVLVYVTVSAVLRGL